MEGLNLLFTKDGNFGEVKFVLLSLRFSKFKLFTWNFSCGECDMQTFFWVTRMPFKFHYYEYFN